MLNLADAMNLNSYKNLHSRVLARLRAARINDQIFELVQGAYENALSADNLVLSRVERRRLLADVLKSVLGEMNNRIG